MDSSDFFYGVGRGLETFGQLYTQRELLKQRRDEEERLRKEDMAMRRLAYDRDLALRKLELGLEDYEPVGNRAAQIDQARALVAAGQQLTPELQEFAGKDVSSLNEMARDAWERVRRGRTVDLPDFDGTTRRYFQPRERTAQGQREELDLATSTSNYRRLLDAGYSPEQARSLMTAPPQIVFEAVLNKINPSARTTYDPSRGAVVNVDQGTAAPVVGLPPRMSGSGGGGGSGSGGQGYNNQIITDESTGERFVFDPRTGKTVGTVTRPDGTPVRDVPQSAREQVAGIDDVLSNLTILESLVSRHGVEVMPGAVKSDMGSAYSAAQLGFKEAARLGAITGPDLSIIERSLPNPTSPGATMQGGKQGVLAGIRRVRQQMENRRRTLEAQYGIPPRAGSDAYQGLR